MVRDVEAKDTILLTHSVLYSQSVRKRYSRVVHTEIRKQ